MGDYIKPNKVTAPIKSITVNKIIFDGGENDWSVASGTWEGTPCFLARWNGCKDKLHGFPATIKTPTWMVIPDWVEDGLMSSIAKRNVELLTIEKNK